MCQPGNRFFPDVKGLQDDENLTRTGCCLSRVCGSGKGGRGCFFTKKAVQKEKRPSIPQDGVKDVLPQEKGKGEKKSAFPGHVPGVNRTSTSGVSSKLDFKWRVNQGRRGDLTYWRGFWPRSSILMHRNIKEQGVGGLGISTSVGIYGDVGDSQGTRGLML